MEKNQKKVTESLCCIPETDTVFGTILQFFSQFSHSVVSYPLQPHGLQHARPPCPSPTSKAYSHSCPSCW